MNNAHRPLGPGTVPAWALGLLLAFLALAPAAGAGEITKTYDFQLDNWIELKVEDGPLTLHRFRIEKAGSGGVNRLTRGGSSDYSTVLEIQLEYTNEATDDWKAHVVVEWLDERGNVIDGFRGNENLDEGDRHELKKMSVTTLKYGIEKARRLRLEVSFDPD